MRKVDVIQLDSGGCQRAKADGWGEGDEAEPVFSSRKHIQFFRRWRSLNVKERATREDDDATEMAVAA